MLTHVLFVVTWRKRRVHRKSGQAIDIQGISGLKLRDDFSKIRNPYRDVIIQSLDASINGTDYVCGPSTLQRYVKKVLAGLTRTELILYREIYKKYVGDVALYSALVNGATPGSDKFYPNNKQGKEFNKRFNDLQRFWDVYTNPIALYSASGHFYENTDLVAQTLELAYDTNERRATKIANYVQEIFQEFPAIGYDFSLWTFNAFAFKDDPAGNGIVLGDGITMFLEDVGLGNAGPDYVIFHEFGHLVQFGNNVSFVISPEGTRRTELMADALAAYYAHSPRGALFQKKRIKEITEAAYGVGDCYFDVTGHHGTPNQRAKAVEFAVNLIDTSNANGTILPSADFIALFDSALPGIVAPDAP